MARLEDVAKAAGVSRGTVSNVFNRPEVVRPEVRKRVRRAARALGYNGPDPTARLFRGGKVNAIAFIMGGDGALFQVFTNPYGRDLLAGIASVCDEHGAGLALVSDLGREKEWAIRNVIADGFVLQRIEDLAHIEAARNRGLPFVVLDDDPGPDISSVQIDDRDGARQAAEHLVRLGHRRFAITTVLRADPAVLRKRGGDPVFHAPARAKRKLVESSPVEDLRLAGYADALKTVGVSINSVPLVEIVSFNTPAALSGAALLLDQAPETTGVLTMSDVQGLAVLEAARQRKIRVPHDLSIVGFDDNPEAALCDPPLTTVAQPIIEKGRAAARILFEGVQPQKVVLPVKLVVRASTAPPRRSGSTTSGRRTRFR
ncbi:MAG: LacI family DNA-binding transcriptional regulator [Bauldia sp.]